MSRADYTITEEPIAPEECFSCKKRWKCPESKNGGTCIAYKRDRMVAPLRSATEKTMGVQ